MTTSKQDIYTRVTSRTLQIWEKASARGLNHGAPAMRKAALPSPAATTASPIAASMCCFFGAKPSRKAMPVRSG